MHKIAWLALLLVAGCSAAPAPAPAPPGDGRDPAAVAAALRSLDACALVGAGSTGVHISPHACRVPGAGPDDALIVETGLYTDPQFSRGPEDLVLDGVRVSRTEVPAACVFTIRTGADLGISVSRDGKPGTGDFCPDAEAATHKTIAALTTPDAVALPAAEQDTCDLLTRAGGDRLADLSPRYGRNMDLCQARRKLSGAEGDGWKAVYSLQITHDVLGRLSNERRDTLDGTAVTVYETNEDCEYGWSTGDSGVADPKMAQRVVRARAPKCDEAAELARAVMALGDAKPAEVAPQRPVALPG